MTEQLQVKNDQFGDQTDHKTLFTNKTEEHRRATDAQTTQFCTLLFVA